MTYRSCIYALPCPSNSISILFPAPPEGILTYPNSSIKATKKGDTPPLEVRNPLLIGGFALFNEYSV